jgi:oxygen-independent coproporphyrinogen-3 oxidase
MEMEEGRDYRELFRQMQVSKENTELVQAVLESQKGIYERKDGNTDLFVSLPFCPTKCAYCSFITAPIDKTRHFLEPYLNALEKETEAAKKLIGNLRSIYVGGGTPFALSAEELDRVLKPLDSISGGVEYTVEAGRPDVFTDEKLKVLKEHGVTRICINPQTFSEKTLLAIGRKHTVEDVYRAFEMIEKYSFDVNVDLIAGLEGENVDTFLDGVEKAIRTNAENITVHCLSLKSGAKLKEECSYLENDEIGEMILGSRKLLGNAGYEPYYMYRQKYQAGNNENVGWTKPKKACVYNVDIMEEIADNLAVGANAVSKRVYTNENRIERFASQKDLKTYLEKIDEIIEKKEKFFTKSRLN